MEGRIGSLKENSVEFVEDVKIITGIRRFYFGNIHELQVSVMTKFWFIRQRSSQQSGSLLW